MVAKETYVEAQMNQITSLFPNLEIRQQIYEHNSKFGRKLFKVALILGILTGIIIFVLLSVITNDSLKYLLTNILFAVMLIIMTVYLLKLDKTRKLLYQKQYHELKLANNHLVIKLHNNFKKYQKKWNIIYFLAIFISSFMALSLFVADLVEFGETSLAPIVILFFFLLVFLIIIMPFNIINFKKFRVKQRQIESELDLNENIY